ncbi:hypothetical protein [Algisphaera agarilytica]|uniref:Glycosyltransferase RgtA/B/C/D-like domain-containing protein n=1 Tax=Algisphaera agarilytica TaxID=1385975 RepID=A0A7X0H4U6_9BACT|nr:hypothetical protein [Algisphaera agarilytica]MBB6429308.1 hypothetical protein [Algisphaera agarilytica]
MAEASTRVTARHLCLIAAAAVAVRAGLMVGFLLVSGGSVESFAGARDGEQFMAYAQNLFSADPSADTYTLRLFPFVPFVAGLIHQVGVPLPWSFLLVSWLGAGAACALAAWVCRSAGVGWFMVAVTPTWLMASTIPATESMNLALVLAGLWVVLRAVGDEAANIESASTSSRWRAAILAGVLFGLSGLARPMGCFGTLAGMAAWCVRGRWREALVCGGTAMGVVGLGIALLAWRFGGLVTVEGYVESEEAYQGGLLAWPFASLVMTPLREPVAAWKLGFVWLHVVFALLACAWLIAHVWRARRTGQAQDERGAGVWPVAMAVWAVSGVLFVLCTGDRWGFHEFPRFIVPYLPALLYPFRGWLTFSKWWVWGPAVAGSLGMAWFGLIRSF